MVNVGARGADMLGLMGLLGALMAGVLADSMMAGKAVNEDDPVPELNPESDASDPVRIVDASSAGVLVPDDPDYQPVSDDSEPVVDSDRNLAADADGGRLGLRR